MATCEKYGVLLSQTSPDFLHANSTSHTWVFSAVAELIDNAYDPDVAAQTMWIDKKAIYNETCLIFMDNGAGLYPERLHRMLSFGYCDKIEIKGHKPVGHYGNGFKSGSMRLGRDALVFTKKARTLSVGFLSQSYLKAIKSETVLVPIVSWDSSTKKIIKKPDSEGSLLAITKYSLFKSELELLMEFEALSKFQTGTRIVIYNLKRSSDGKLELDLDSNRHDIINSEHQIIDSSQGTVYRPVREYTPEYRRSLREYCSTLFLKPRMKIILRNKKVRTKLISKSLMNTETDSYKPMWLDRPVRMVFGFAQNGTDYGVMLYHRNRLIKAYEKVGIQKQQNGQGKGVVGVVEVDFLEPIHNKQDFNKTDKYNACMTALGQKLNDYWNEKTNQGGASNPVQIKPDWDWVQCDNCLKWRRLPDGVDSDDLPEKWFCFLNQDATHNRCDVDEEPEDEDWVLQKGASYKKIYKKQQGKEKEKKRVTLEDRQRQLEEKERELLKIQQQILHSSAQRPQQRKEEFEKQQRQLEEARQREMQQKQLILRLQQEKEKAERDQQLLKKTVEHVVKAQAGGKRKGGDMASSGGKKVKMVDVEQNFVVEENISDSESEDRPGPARGGLKVKLPSPKKKNVIVIDSGSEDESDIRPVSPVDKKPDVAELNKAITNTSSSDDSSAPQSVPVTATDVPPAIPEPSTSTDAGASNGNCSPLIAKSGVHRNTQTDPVKISSSDSQNANNSETEKLRNELEESKSTLTNLREKVSELLKSVLPNLSVDNLEDIDKIVAEFVRVNAEEGDTSSSQLLSPQKNN